MREILPKPEPVEYVPREQQLADMAAREEKAFRDGQRQRRLQVRTRRCRFTNVRSWG
jgi:hypothetical protein